MVHNFYHLNREAEVKNAIENDIRKAFDVSILNHSSKALLLDEKKAYHLNYYLTKKRSIYHMVYVNDAHPWGFQYNDPTVKYLKFCNVEIKGAQFG